MSSPVNLIQIGVDANGSPIYGMPSTPAAGSFVQIGVDANGSAIYGMAPQSPKNQPQPVPPSEPPKVGRFGQCIVCNSAAENLCRDSGAPICSTNCKQIHLSRTATNSTPVVATNSYGAPGGQTSPPQYNIGPPGISYMVANGQNQAQNYNPGNEAPASAFYPVMSSSTTISPMNVIYPNASTTTVILSSNKSLSSNPWISILQRWGEFILMLIALILLVAAIAAPQFAVNRQFGVEVHGGIYSYCTGNSCSAWSYSNLELCKKAPGAVGKFCSELQQAQIMFPIALVITFICVLIQCVLACTCSCGGCCGSAGGNRCCGFFSIILSLTVFALILSSWKLVNDAYINQFPAAVYSFYRINIISMEAGPSDSLAIVSWILCLISAIIGSVLQIFNYRSLRVVQ